MTASRLRTRILLAVGSPMGIADCAAAAAQPTQVVFEPAPAPAPNSPPRTAALDAPAPAPTSAPQGSGGSEWLVTFPVPQAPSWCAEGTARCHERSPAPPATNGTSAGRLRCVAEIQVLCGCTGGVVCPDPNALCPAPLHVATTNSARASHGAACCYEVPTHCVPPSAGRPLRTRARGQAFAVVATRDDWAA